MSRYQSYHRTKNVAKCVPVPLTEVQLKGIFRRHDINGDGLLSKQELREAFKSLGAYVPGWRAGRALVHADINGDGYINEDEMDQLVKYALKWGYNIK